MSPWHAGKLVEYHMSELRAAARGRLGEETGRYRRVRSPRRLGERVSVWCGYRLIDLGSRLLRPALLTGA